MLEEVRRYLAENYPSQAKVWKPLKFVKKTLHIKVANSAAASSLYLYQSQIMDDFVSHDLLRVVQEIKIDK